MNKTIYIAQKLITIPSITPNGSKVLDYISSLLSEIGFVSYRCKYKDVDNLYAIYEGNVPNKNRNLCFLGHCDVVDPGDTKLWKYHPFQGTIADGYLWGRGACDMKTSIACFICACEKFISYQKHFEGSIIIMITCDEEGPALYGTKHIVNEIKKNNIRISHCIIGEPTSMKKCGDAIKIGRRGSINGTIVFNGKQGHVAYPENLCNPLHEIGLVIKELGKWKIDNGNNYFPPSHIQMTQCATNNNTVNMTPQKVIIGFNIRYGNQSCVDDIIENMKNIIHQNINVPWLEWKIDIVSSSLPFYTSSKDISDILYQAIYKVTHNYPIVTTSGGTSDGRFVHDICPLVECGLLSKTIHQVNERTPLEDINILEKIYFKTLEAYFA